MNIRRKILIVSALLFCMANSHAEDVLTVNNVILPQNGEVAIEITGNFESNFTMMELTIELPEGLSLKKDKYGLPWAELGIEGTDHTFTSSTPSFTTYQYVCSSMHQEPLPSSGVLMRVTAIAEEGLETGTVFNGSVKNIILSEHTSEGNNVGHKFDDIPFTVTISEPLDTRTLLDENSTTAPTEASGVDVRVRRTIKSGQWSTICLPFAMTEAQVKTAFGDDVQLADFNDYEYDDAEDAISVKFVDANSIEANHPYIIKVSSPVSEFTADGVNIDPQEAIVDFDTSRRKNQPRQMVGTYVAETVLDWGTLFISDNQFWYSVGKTKMKAFRAYFNFNDLLADFEDNYESRISMAFDDTTTGVSTLQSGEALENGGVYDLQGRKVSEFDKQKSLQRGLYIQNCKKVIK